jgi:inner membrane transporter RhtA
LFPVLGAQGTVAFRIIISALLLWIAARGRVHTFARTFWQHRGLLLLFGFCMAAMNLFFYLAIERIPLGVAVAFEFIGPLSVATFNSRKLSQFLWIALAAFGILLLSPLSGANLSTTGILFALLAGAGWATFIILVGRVSTAVPGDDGLAISMSVAAVIMLPFALPVSGALFGNPLILLAALAVALLSTTLPFMLEFQALKTLSRRAYGVLVSLEPAVAALVGVVFLNENIGLRGLIAVALVVTAAIGITLGEQSANND